MNSKTSQDHYDTTDNLKLSADEILIITPENTTYTTPMSGYYPATYGFENDEDGSDPEGWSLIENPPNYEIEVIPEKEGHKKVVHLSDNENEWRSMSLYPDGNPPTGTIELWVLGADVTDSYFGIVMWDTTISRKGFQVHILNDKWQYCDSGGYHNITNVGIPQDNIWHHLRIDYRCASAPSYQGLSMASYKVIIDGIESDEISFFDPNANNLHRLAIATDAAPNSEWWVDAIGLSWDLNYNLGDNINKGLLLSFENNTSLVWMGYSLDGQINKTILGNITLLFPEYGAHNIQVFGNISSGTIYASNLRHFTIGISIITIISPENTTYTAPMSGYYPATYGFENDEDGSDPEGWSLIENPPDYEIEVVSEKEGHKKVVHLYDNEYEWHSMSHYPDGDPPTGTIELWVLGADVTDSYFGIVMWDTTTSRKGFQVHILDDKWQYCDNGGYHDITNVGIPQDNTWHHLRIDYRCAGAASYQGLSMASYKVIIDGIESSEISFFDTNTNNLHRLAIATDAAPNSEWWVDSIGFSWDLNYNFGDNLYEGLLLSFENNTTLEWMGYSLDGQTNRTILGNTTISMLADGSHNIQVFGSDSLGTIYESNIRYFSISGVPPSISILSPLNDEFYGNFAPHFSISIISLSKVTTWYTIDGLTSILFTGLTGIINQTIWDLQGEGAIIIRFYANDSFGRVNYDDISINKDITDPIINIHSPLSNDEFINIPPSFNISVDELNIDTIWYTIDDGLKNYSITQYNGNIDLTAWKAAPIGAINIRFYVRDRAGNIAYADVIVQKNAPTYLPPDYTLFIIISVAIGGFIAAISVLLVVFLLRKRRASPPKPPRPEIKRTIKQKKPIIREVSKKIAPPTHVIVQREVIVVEKKPLEKEKLDREKERRNGLEDEKEMKKVKCLFCGSLINHDARICPKCGNQLF